MLLFDNILIQELKEESTVITAGETKKRVIKGKVIGVGKGQSYGLPAFEPTVIQKDDIIYFLKDMAYKVKIEEKEYYIVREREALMVLNR